MNVPRKTICSFPGQFARKSLHRVGSKVYNRGRGGWRVVTQTKGDIERRRLIHMLIQSSLHSCSFNPHVDGTAADTLSTDSGRKYKAQLALILRRFLQAQCQDSFSAGGNFSSSPFFHSFHFSLFCSIRPRNLLAKVEKLVK